MNEASLLLISLKLLGGFILGLVVGSIGAGGSLIAIPILEDLYYVTPEHASILSLIVVIFVYLTALALNYRELKGWFQSRGFHLSILYGFFGAILSNISSRYGHHLGDQERTISFAILLNVACIIMILNTIFIEGKNAVRPGVPERGGMRSPSYVILNALVASFLGILTGIFGVGGGFLLVPVVLFAARVSFNYAVICSMVISTVNSLSSLTASYEIVSGEEILKAIILSFFGVLGIFASIAFKRFILKNNNKETFEKISKILYAIIVFGLSLRYYLIYFHYL